MPNICSGFLQFGPDGIPSVEFRVIWSKARSKSVIVLFTMVSLLHGSVPWMSPSVPSSIPPKSVSGTSHLVHVMFSM